MNKAVSTQIDPAQLKAVQSFDEALALIGGMDNVTHIGDVVGDGYSLLEDKSTLAKTAFMIVEMSDHVDKDTGRVFWSLRVVTRQGDRYIVNDGGTGIAVQCAEMRDAGITLPVYCRGLRRSDYIHPEHGASTTFYFDTSK